MSIRELLHENRRAILGSWRKRVMETYSKGGRPALKVKDRFSNPILNVVFEATEGVLDALASGEGRESIEASLDPLIRMRAVQDFTAAEALGFVFELKTAVHKSAPGVRGADLHCELDRCVDEVALTAFDLYVACREKASNLKVRMMRDRSYMLMKRAGMLWEESDDTEVAVPKRGDAL